jgi:hypothetical protein
MKTLVQKLNSSEEHRSLNESKLGKRYLINETKTKVLNKKFWKELICLLSLYYLKMSFALKPAFSPT